jgi:hypothetical protein
MGSAIDTVMALRQKKAKRLADCESQRASIDAEIVNLKAHLECLDQTLKELGPHIEAEVNTVIKETLLEIEARKYTGKQLTESILDVLNHHGRPPGLWVSEITRHLKAGGATSTAKDFYTTIYAICNRMADRNRILRGARDGKRTFVTKQPF